MTKQPVRLPTEDEWYRLYDAAQLSEVPLNAPATGNLHLDYYASSCPVQGLRRAGFDNTGNVWQWLKPLIPLQALTCIRCMTISPPTFDNQHNLIKGGSWIACGNCSSRYAFRRHFFQHAGFRYVVSDAPATLPSSNYETDKLLSEYAEFHYGDSYFDVPNFPKTLAEIAVASMGNRPKRTALDLGCASGRSTFELARHFDHVTGIDFSARFIGQGAQLAQQGILRYTLADEGDLVSI